MPPKFKVISLKDAKKQQENAVVASAFRSSILPRPPDASFIAVRGAPGRAGGSINLASPAAPRAGGTNGSATAAAKASSSTFVSARFRSSGLAGKGTRVANPYAKKNVTSTALFDRPPPAVIAPPKRVAASSIVSGASPPTTSKRRRPLPPAVGPSASFSQAFGEFDADEGFDEGERAKQRSFDDTQSHSPRGVVAASSVSASPSTTTTTAGTVAGVSARENQAHLQPHVLHVSTRQRGNPILRFVRNVPFEYSKMVPDYIMGHTRCALFLSLRYHSLNPDYVHRRVAELGSDFDLRVLLCLVDADDNAAALLLLNDICVQNRLSLLLAWSEEEAGRYLETFKAFDGRDASSIQKRDHANYADQVSDVLGSVRSINKTDAGQLLMQFGNLKNLVAASVDELSMCPGVGPKKVRRLFEAFRKPFSSRVAKKRREQKEEAEFLKALEKAKEEQNKKGVTNPPPSTSGEEC